MGNLKSRMTVFHSRTVISISHVVIGKISAQPHTTLCIQSLDRENNDKNNILPLGKQICLQKYGAVQKFYRSNFPISHIDH